MSAALAAGPALPRAVAAAVSAFPPNVAGTTSSGADGLVPVSGRRALLQIGSEGGLVTAAQRRLNEVLPLTHLAVDGIFGPRTRGAVLAFQRQRSLPATGAIDVQMWTIMFKAPVLVMAETSVLGSAGPATGSPGSTSVSTGAETTDHRHLASARLTSHQPAAGGGHPGAQRTQASADGGHAGPSGSAGTTPAGSSGTTPAGPSGTTPAGPSGTVGGRSAGRPGIAVVTPTSPSSQPSTYVLTNGVALPLPRAYLVNGFVDQGVDYSAPGGTALYAMGDGVIIGEGISGFGPNAPILRITSGPLKGLEVYYGHAGSNLEHVGQHVKAGQQISGVGRGIVGISTGPHLEIGFYPPGPVGGGSRMLGVINGLLGQHPTGRVWGTTAPASARDSGRRPAASSGHAASAAKVRMTVAHNSSTRTRSSAPSPSRSGQPLARVASLAGSDVTSAEPTKRSAPTQAAPPRVGAAQPEASGAVRIAAPAPPASTTTPAPAAVPKASAPPGTVSSIGAGARGRRIRPARRPHRQSEPRRRPRWLPQATPPPRQRGPTRTDPR